MIVVFHRNLLDWHSTIVEIAENFKLYQCWRNINRLDVRNQALKNVCLSFSLQSLLCLTWNRSSFHVNVDESNSERVDSFTTIGSENLCKALIRIGCKKSTTDDYRRRGQLG